MTKNIIIYTDGAALGNPGPGGFGVVMIYGEYRKEIAEGFRKTTNNRMELMAVIRALQKIKSKDIPVEVYTDSKYVCDAVLKGWLENWKKKGFKKVKNPDLWKLFDQEHQNFKQVNFNWVKGHAGIKENERCDELATGIARKGPTAIDSYYESQEESGELF